MTEDEKILRKKLRDDLQYYCRKNLKIRIKKEDGEGNKIIPFVWNKAQIYIHAKLEQQRKKYGRVRALILKGRQQGCSTYIAARFYHKTTHKEGRKTHILTHENKATGNLFNLVKRYHKHCSPIVKPSTSNTNEKALVFDVLDSAYSVGTAGSGDGGRSDTIDYFHGSEAAMWSNPEDIQAGVMQAANEAEEIIYETTAKGFDATFKPKWDIAERGESEYMAIFVPWFWQEEYSLDVPEDFKLTDDEQKLLKDYEADGLELGNIVWRRNKISSDFNNDAIIFKQEYPCTSAEAFQQTGVDSFIPAELVISARKRKEARQDGPHIVGLDPARGGDRTAFVHRQGACMWYKKEEVLKTPNTRVIKKMIIGMFNDATNPVDHMFIDVGAGGGGGQIYDNFTSTIYEDRMTLVNFGSTDCHQPERYVNRKAEMAGNMKDWLEDDVFPPKITDCDVLQKDICAAGSDIDSLQRIFLESKKSLKKRGIPSTDLFDAGKLTFAEPVIKYTPDSYDDCGGIDML